MGTLRIKNSVSEPNEAVIVQPMNKIPIKANITLLLFRYISFISNESKVKVQIPVIIQIVCQAKLFIW